MPVSIQLLNHHLNRSANILVQETPKALCVLSRDKPMTTFAMAFLQDHLLATTAADASNATHLIRQGPFAVCRRWNEAFMREPACWRHLRLHAVTDRLIYRLLDFTKIALTSHGRYHFQHLNFDDGKITDTGMNSWGKNSPSLTHVSLLGCREITDAGIGALASNCQTLKKISLNSCRQITDAAIVAIATDCSSLVHLNLGCRQITDTGITALANNCPERERERDEREERERGER